jgi:hypothetical protein
LILVAETGGRADSEPEKDGEASMLKPMCAGAIAVLALAAPAAAQTEDALRSAFEGKRVTLRIDMPGTSDGVDVQGDARQALDYKEYGRPAEALWRRTPRRRFGDRHAGESKEGSHRGPTRGRRIRHLWRRYQHVGLHPGRAENRAREEPREANRR